MSGNAGNGGGTKVPLTLWVHDGASQPTLQPSTPAQSFGVPLASTLANEIVLNPELLQNEALDVAIGDLVELVKVSPSASSSNGQGHSTGPASVQGSTNGYTRSQSKTRRRSHRTSNSAPGHAATSGASASTDSLVFRIERSSMASEGSSGQLQISISQHLAQAFGLKNRDQIFLRKLPSPLPKDCIADHVELYFKDQYLGRADMHRIALALTDCCVYKDQKVQLAGLNIRARVGGVWVAGKQRKSALFTDQTRTVFRSESAKYYVFLQLSREMWMFDEDGSLFFEKAVDLFLPELFSRWEKKGNNHIVSIVLFSRIIYEKEEIDVVDRPMMCYDADKHEERWTDVYKVVVDLETNMDWSQVLTSLRREFQNFRQDVLLRSQPRADHKLAGRISAAHEGGVLEAVNMALSAFDKHYVDRDLQRTGLSIVIITAGTSQFNVDKNLLRLTTERMIDEGFGVDCVSLAKMPLHAVPLFRYKGTVPKRGVTDATTDHLYVEDPADATKEPVYTIPYWVDSSFYAKHQDKPFRCDRFLPRCRMPSITSIGIAEYDNASIALPAINNELKVLEGFGPEWEQLSKREKLRSQFEKFDSIACGAWGKWQLLDLAERRNNYGARKTRRYGSLATNTSSSIDAATRSFQSRSSGTGGSGSDQGGSSTEDESGSTALVFQRSRNRAKPTTSASDRMRPTPIQTVPSASPETYLPRQQMVRKPTRLHDEARSTAVNSPRQPGREEEQMPRRSRADSNVSIPSLARQPSYAALKSPSVAAATRHVSAAPSERRIASSSASSVTAVEKAQPTRGGAATSALSSIMAAQARMSSGSQPPEKPSAASAVTNWLWGKRNIQATNTPPPPKAAATTSVSKALDGAFNSLPRRAGASSPGNARESSPSSAVSRRSSLVSMKRPVASLSITPATPATATTTSGQGAMAAYSSSQPINVKPSAVQDDSGGPGSFGKSLEEHSLQQYFLEEARRRAQETESLKAKIEAERSKRMVRLNPSNPSRSSGQLQNQSRRWVNIFPRAGRINNQRSVKWKSLCTPACLPLYSDYIPSFEQLSDSYTKETYSLPISQSMSSFLLRAGKDISETAGNLLRELVNQRLAQSFQIILPPYDGTPRSARFSHSRSKSDSAWVLPQAGDIRNILYNTPAGEGKAIFLGFSNIVHRIRYDKASCSIVITTWREKIEWSTRSVDYSFVLWPVENDKYQTSKVTFAYPALGGYDWQYTDRLIAGLEEPKLQEKTRYWRTRFVLIPTEVPDLQGMIQSQSKVLLEDSTEDDLRIAGVMTLYEQFSKARWYPQTKDRHKTQLVYSTTPYDPSIYATDEAERLTSTSTDVPLPDAYSEDLFFEDLTPREIARLMLEGPRPLRFQPRRSGFRKIEDSFTGQDFVTWLKDEFVDIPDRGTALLIGNDLVQKGVVLPLNPPKRLVDGYTFYQIASDYKPGKAAQATSSARWLSEGLDPGSFVQSQSQSQSYMDQSADGGMQSLAPLVRYAPDGKLIIPMSHSILINLDTHKKSDRRETAFLHFDAAHNTTNGFHFQLNWLGTSRLVEDLLTSWQRNMQKYGLKLVEENVRQIKDICQDNPLQAAEHIRLAIPPPEMPELSEILSKTVVFKDYFETQLLRDLGYILDVEADADFPDHVLPEYSYRRTPFQHSQLIHRSGCCFVQVLGGGQGFLFLKNRLFLSHRQQKRSTNSALYAKAAGHTVPSTATTLSSAAQHTGSFLARTQSYYQSQQYQAQVQELNEPHALKRQLQEICASADELHMRWENMVNAILMVAAGNTGSVVSGSVGNAASTIAPSETLRSGKTTLRSFDASASPADRPLPESLPGSSLPYSLEEEEDTEEADA